CKCASVTSPNFCIRSNKVEASRLTMDLSYSDTSRSPRAPRSFHFTLSTPAAKRKANRSRIDLAEGLHASYKPPTSRRVKKGSWKMANGKRRTAPGCSAGLSPFAFYLLPFTYLLACGCAGFWDDVTSRDFSWSALFTKPNPLLVL